MDLDRRDNPIPFILTEGFLESERSEVARMYWAAFGSKLGVVLGPQERAIAMLAEAVNPRLSVVVRTDKGRLIGVAGYKTEVEAFIAINYRCLKRHFGIVGGLVRLAALAILDRQPNEGVLLMDGIFVAEGARGNGVGGMLLRGVKQKAKQYGCSHVRLDVTDTNPRAQELYKREGFHPVSVQKLGVFRHLFGFQSAITMLAESDATISEVDDSSTS